MNRPLVAPSCGCIFCDLGLEPETDCDGNLVHPMGLREPTDLAFPCERPPEEPK